MTKQIYLTIARQQTRQWACTDGSSAPHIPGVAWSSAATEQCRRTILFSAACCLLLWSFVLPGLSRLLCTGRSSF